MTTMLPKTAMMIVIFTIIITTTIINTSLSDKHQNDWKKSPRYGCCSQVSSAQVLIEVISINIVIEFENFCNFQPHHSNFAGNTPNMEPTDSDQSKHET